MRDSMYDRAPLTNTYAATQADQQGDLRILAEQGSHPTARKDGDRCAKYEWGPLRAFHDVRVRGSRGSPANDLVLTGGRRIGAERPRRPSNNIGARPRLRNLGRAAPVQFKTWLGGDGTLPSTSGSNPRPMPSRTRRLPKMKWEPRGVV